MVSATPLVLASRATLSFVAAGTPNLRKRQRLSSRNQNLVGRAPGDVNATASSASSTSAYALPDPQTLGTSSTGTALLPGSTSTGTPSTVQAIQAAFDKSSPLYPVAIGVATLIGIIGLLIFIAITKAIAHRARFRDKKEYNENVAAPPATQSRPASSSKSLVDKQEKVEPSGVRSSSPSSSSSVASRRTSSSSDISSHYDPLDSSKNLVNFPSSKSLHAGSTAAPSILSYTIKIDPRRPSLPSTLRPATLSPTTSVHRVVHTPSIRRPSLHLGTQTSSSRSPVPAFPRLPTLHARFALPDEPVAPHAIPPSPSSFPVYSFPPSSPNSTFSFPPSSPNSTFSFPSATSPLFSTPPSPLFSLVPPTTRPPVVRPSSAPPPATLPFPALPPATLPSPVLTPAALPSPALPPATLPFPVLPPAALRPLKAAHLFLPKPLLLRRKSEAAPYAEWKGPIERSLSIAVEEEDRLGF